VTGAIAPGYKADFVAHDRDRPEWVPLLNVVNQLVWSADGRGVHSVWVAGRRVVDTYCMTTIDEKRLFAEVEAAAPGLIARSGLPVPQVWPVL
jgi:cytosine/adenosine deaminase-related metal-dependent hydrolase